METKKSGLSALSAEFRSEEMANGMAAISSPITMKALLWALAERIEEVCREEVQAAKKAPNAEDIAICILGDYKLMREKGEATYPEVFFSEQVDVYELSNALREAGKDPYIPFPPAVRYLILNAGFILAKQCGWKLKKAPAKEKEREKNPKADSPEKKEGLVENVRPGNAAKMRKALGKIAIHEVDERCTCADCSARRELRDIARNALLYDQPRNCDIYETAEEAWRYFKMTHKQAHFDTPTLDRFKDWLFAPVKQKGEEKA